MLKVLLAPSIINLVLWFLNLCSLYWTCISNIQFFFTKNKHLLKCRNAEIMSNVCKWEFWTQIDGWMDTTKSFTGCVKFTWLYSRIFWMLSFYLTSIISGHQILTKCSKSVCTDPNTVSLSFKPSYEPKQNVNGHWFEVKWSIRETILLVLMVIASQWQQWLSNDLGWYLLNGSGSIQRRRKNPLPFLPVKVFSTDLIILNYNSSKISFWATMKCPKFKMVAIIQNGCYTVNREIKLL